MRCRRRPGAADGLCSRLFYFYFLFYFLLALLTIPLSQSRARMYFIMSGIFKCNSIVCAIGFYYHFFFRAVHSDRLCRRRRSCCRGRH